MTQRRDYRRLARRRGQGVEKLLGQLEAEVMAAIWERDGTLRVREVMEALNAGRARPVAYTTVMTVMARLAEKGILKRELVGQTYQYRAAMTAAQLVEQASEEIAARLIEDFGGRIAVAGFLSALERVDPERLREMGEKLSERGQGE